MGIFHAVALKEVVTILIHAIHACHNTAKSKGIHDAQTPILSVSPSSFSLSLADSNKHHHHQLQDVCFATFEHFPDQCSYETKTLQGHRTLVI